MRRDREELIDLLLEELPPERAAGLSAEIDRDPALAAERDLYARAADLLRAAAAEGWTQAPARRGRLRYLRPVAAVAALLLLALALLFTNGRPQPRVFEPADVAFGYLYPEETDVHGNVPVPSRGQGYVLRAGTLETTALGAERSHTARAGETVRVDSEVRSPADAAVRMDLPGGGILFLAPLSTVQVRQRDDGHAALRLIGGEAAVVADGEPVHLAVEGTDLLLTLERGAAFTRRSPDPETVCLRGDLYLERAEGVRFLVPPGQRLPAACADDPRTVPSSDEDLCLDWYRGLVYAEAAWEELTWGAHALRHEVADATGRHLYLRIVPRSSGRLEVRFGGEPREFALHKNVALELRLELSRLGPGPLLEVTPSAGIQEARLFAATPRR